MSDESISVEETNKLRKSLGLPLIPVENEAPALKPPGEEASIEETNRIRASLGLRPIPTESAPEPATPVPSEDEIAHTNWLSKVESENKLAFNDKIKKKIEETRMRAQRRKLLDGKTLGDDDDKDATGVPWIKKFRQMQKQQQLKRLQQDIEAVDEPAALSQYTSQDLKGIKVAHDIDDLMSMNTDTVLTLKDTSVFDEGETELISAALQDKEKVRESSKAKAGKTRYDFNDEYDGKAEGVLSKYDDEPEEKFFVLDGSQTIATAKISEDAVQKLDRIQATVRHETLDFNPLVEVNSSSDYQEAKPIKFKKPKKSKKQVASQATEKKRKRLDDDDEFVIPRDDDEELQNILAKNRRKIQRTTVTSNSRLTPEELAEKLLIEKEEAEAAALDSTVDADGGVVIGDAVDFLAAIRRSGTPGPEDTPEVETTDVVHNVGESVPGEGFEIAEAEPDAERTMPVISAAQLAEEEPTLGGGMADALKLLQSKGAIKKLSAEERERERQAKEQRDWMRQMDKERLIREIELQRRKEEDRASGKLDGLSHKEREELAMRHNRLRESEDAAAAQQRFENYKPEVNIVYRDEFGNALSTRDAYKHMAQQFHGTRSGKKKVEKRLQKLQETQDQERQSLFQTDQPDASSSQKKLGVRMQ